MTPDDLQRALAYRITELRILSDAIGAAQRDALANSIALDDPSVLICRWCAAMSIRPSPRSSRHRSIRGSGPRRPPCGRFRGA
jgi:hypothetical protein